MRGCFFRADSEFTVWSGTADTQVFATGKTGGRLCKLFAGADPTTGRRAYSGKSASLPEMCAKGKNI